MKAKLAKYRTMNGRSSTHYPLCRPPKCRKLHAFIHSLSKGLSVQAKIDDSSSKKQIPCHEFNSRAIFKCSKCGSLDSIVALCNKELNDKDCLAQYHNK